MICDPLATIREHKGPPGCKSQSKPVLSLIFFADDAQLTPLLRLGAGACAGIIAMSATYPMDMVRGRLTVQVLILSPLPFVW